MYSKTILNFHLKKYFKENFSKWILPRLKKTSTFKQFKNIKKNTLMMFNSVTTYKTREHITEPWLVDFRHSSTIFITTFPPHYIISQSPNTHTPLTHILYHIHVENISNAVLERIFRAVSWLAWWRARP